MTKKLVVKDKLLDDTLDLSCCDLKEVPVKEISVLRKARIVDLSNNDLVSLPKNFITLTQIVKLDLSKNNLTELPENFGELVQLKHLDLYGNQISRLPLSLANLKNLRWLDLKENPLTPAVASIAGPCTNASDCQNCARNVVKYLSNVKQTFEEAQRFKNETVLENEAVTTAAKKESQKKKKKKADKEKNNSPNANKLAIDKNDSKSNKAKSKNKHVKSNNGGLIHFLFSAFSWLILLLFFTIILIPFLPNAEEILDYLRVKTGLPIKPVKLDVQVPPLLKQRVNLILNYTRTFIEDVYKKYFEQNTMAVDKDL